MSSGEPLTPEEQAIVHLAAAVRRATGNLHPLIALLRDGEVEPNAHDTR
jgi:hypothetical protein